MIKFELLVHTLRHLQFKQVWWRMVYAFKSRIPRKNLINIPDTLPSKGYFNSAIPFLPANPAYLSRNTFRFINIQYTFSVEPKWNFPDHGRLWTYNLNYFDFLLQPDMNKETGMALIRNYCDNVHTIKDGLEPYPTSLRCMNWIKFIINHKIHDAQIDKYLWAQVKHLTTNLEYHLLGNHLLENAFALTIASLYFDDYQLRKKAQKLLLKELNEQVLDDGAHFELSPMYHQIILGRLLDTINLARAGKDSHELANRLEAFASKMLGWIKTISFGDGYIPLLNDAAYGIAPNTKNLLEYSKKLGIKSKSDKLNKSGYRVFENEYYKCIADVGPVGPDYQPGHAHADTFSFVLNHNGKPLIIDTGTSTYEPGERRNIERSTAAHNTVVVENKNSSDVWASHRVGKRARVKVIHESHNSIVAQHNGYQSLGVFHQRQFLSKSKKLIIQDELITKKDFMSGTFHLHFGPGVEPLIKESIVQLADGVCIEFEGSNSIKSAEYLYAHEFNKTIPSLKLEVIFTHQLITNIHFENPVSY
jgi:hypothetical protein